MLCAVAVERLTVTAEPVEILRLSMPYDSLLMASSSVVPKPSLSDVPGEVTIKLNRII